MRKREKGSSSRDTACVDMAVGLGGFWGRSTSSEPGSGEGDLHGLLGGQ